MENGLMICLDEIKFRQVLYKDHINKHFVFFFLHHKKIKKIKNKHKIQEDTHEESLEDYPSCGEGPK
jgi:hypothetical protein